MSNKKGLDEVLSYVGTNREMYDAMERHGFRLPKFSAPIITSEYMQRVRKGEYLQILAHEAKHLPCPDKPRKSVLLDELERLCASKQPPVTTGFTQKKQPDTEFVSSRAS